MTLITKYELLVKNHRRQGAVEVIQTFYGQLQYIVELTHHGRDDIQPPIPISGSILLACIQPCITNGKDATQELTSYRRMSTTIFVDLKTVECVVGRVKRGQDWFIIDRSGDFARTVFIEPELEDE